MCSKSKETTKRLASRNIRFIRTAFSIVKAIRITPYSCKYSKKIYTQYQLLVLILFKHYRNHHYRDFIEDIGDMELIQEELDLSDVPHFTTLQKLFCRIKPCTSATRLGESVLFQRGSNPRHSNRFIRVYQRIFQSLLLDQNRQDSKAFPENLNLG